MADFFTPFPWMLIYTWYTAVYAQANLSKTILGEGFGSHIHPLLSLSSSAPRFCFRNFAPSCTKHQVGLLSQGLKKNSNASLSFGASSSYILLVQGHFLLILGHFPFVRTGQPDNCWMSQLANEIGFFQGFLQKNHLLPAHHSVFRIWLIWLDSFD